MKFTGCGTAMVTPFKSDGSLDEETLRNLVKRQVDLGIHFLVPCGTTGESPTLTTAEHLRVVEITVEAVAGRVPVLAGCGGYNTAAVVDLAKEINKLGVDGLLSVTPYYNKPSPEGLYQHYKAIADTTDLPIILYSVAGRTMRNIAPEEVTRLAALPTVVGIKEASGSISQMSRICQGAADDFAVLSGDDAVTLPLMALGGVGLISVASNEIPAEMSKLCELAAAGDFAGARAVHRKYLNLMDVNFAETSPGPVKYAMAKMGLLEPNYRLPMVSVTAQTAARVDAVLAELDLA